jgi:hypothetical protein
VFPVVLYGTAAFFAISGRHGIEYRHINSVF